MSERAVADGAVEDVGALRVEAARVLAGRARVQAPTLHTLCKRLVYKGLMFVTYTMKSFKFKLESIMERQSFLTKVFSDIVFLPRNETDFQRKLMVW